MTAGWHYRGGDGGIAEAADDALAELVRSGRITASTPLWRRGEVDERTASAAEARLFAVPPPYTGPPARGVWTDATPHPWRRFVARVLDIVIVGDLLFVILLSGTSDITSLDRAAIERFPANWTETLINVVLATALVAPANAFLLARSGTTLGKKLLAIRITRDGEVPTVRQALRREATVWLFGLGLGLPPLLVLANAVSYRRLVSTGTTRWDAELGLDVRYGPLRPSTLAGLIALATILAGLQVLAAIL